MCRPGMVVGRDDHLSVLSPTLCRMQNPDIPDNGDAAGGEVLARIAGHADDPAKREFVLDLLLTTKLIASTCPPVPATLS